MDYGRNYTQRQNRYTRNNNNNNNNTTIPTFPSPSSSSSTNNKNEIEYEKAIFQLRQFAQILLFTSFFFWCWAQYNTYSMRTSATAAATDGDKDGVDKKQQEGGEGYDAGIYSFACTFSSSLWILCRYTGFTTKSVLNTRKKGGSSKDDTLDYLLTSSSSLTPTKEEEEEEEDNNNPPPPMPNYISQFFITASHFIVMANYALGLFFACTINGKRIYMQFALYCLVFAIGWGVVLVYGWRVMGRVRGWGNDVWRDRGGWGDGQFGDVGDDGEEEVEALLGGNRSSGSRTMESNYFEEENDDNEEDDYMYSLGAGRGTGRGGGRFSRY